MIKAFLSDLKQCLSVLLQFYISLFIGLLVLKLPDKFGINITGIELYSNWTDTGIELDSNWTDTGIELD